MPETVQITGMVQGILNIAENFFSDGLSKESVHLNRFLTHVKYLAVRLQQGEQLHGEEEFRINQLENCQEELLCGKKIASFILQEYDITLSEEEIFYLVLYIKRLRMRSDNNV
jgi:beta-glucoside operon transcriptional antiterminator